MSVSLKALKAKCKAIQSTQKVVDAMRLICASRFQSLLKKLPSVEASFDALHETMVDIWRTSTEIERNAIRENFFTLIYSNLIDDHANETTHETMVSPNGQLFSFDDRHNVKNNLLIVITSDKSLCGGFNSAITKLASDYIINGANYVYQSADQDNVTNDISYSITKKLENIICIGRRGLGYFHKHSTANSRIIADYSIPRLKFFNFNNVESSIISPLMTWIREIKPSSVSIVYSRFISTLKQQPVIDRLFDANLIFARTLNACEGARYKHQTLMNTMQAGGDSPFNNLQYFLDDNSLNNRGKIFGEVARQYLINKLYNAIFHTTIGEYAARMVTMENAANNAEEMLDKLRLLYNSKRQAKITQELVEVISGSEAI